MNEQDIVDQITSAIEQQDAEHANDDEQTDLCSFEDAGMLTNNKGIVLTAPDGSEFQITIVKSN